MVLPNSVRTKTRVSSIPSQYLWKTAFLNECSFALNKSWSFFGLLRLVKRNYNCSGESLDIILLTPNHNGSIFYLQSTVFFTIESVGTALWVTKHSKCLCFNLSNLTLIHFIYSRYFYWRETAYYPWFCCFFWTWSLNYLAYFPFRQFLFFFRYISYTI